MPLRRRRDGAAVQARTEEQSSGSRKGSGATESTSVFSTVSPFAGRHPRGTSAGATRRGALQTSAASRAGDPGARGATRRARATSSKSARLPLLERLGPQSVPSTQVERGVRKPARDRSRLAGSQCGNAPTGQRNRHRLVPASSGAKAPLACEDRTLVRVCPRVDKGCRSRQATPRPEKRAPVGNGARGRGPGLREAPQGSAGVKRRREPESRWPSRACQRSPEPDVRKGVAGRGSLLDGRHLGSLLAARIVHARRVGWSRRLSRRRMLARAAWPPMREATGVSEVRSARIAMGRQRPPRWTTRERTCDPPKRIALT